jgi:hypothetical protein
MPTPLATTTTQVLRFRDQEVAVLHRTDHGENNATRRNVDVVLRHGPSSHQSLLGHPRGVVTAAYRRGGYEVDMADGTAGKTIHGHRSRAVEWGGASWATAETLDLLSSAPTTVTLWDAAGFDALSVIHRREGNQRVWRDSRGVEVIRIDGAGQQHGPGAFFLGDDGARSGAATAPVHHPWPSEAALSVQLVGLVPMSRLVLDGPQQQVLSEQPFVVRFRSGVQDFSATELGLDAALTADDDDPRLLSFARGGSRDALADVLEILPRVHALVRDGVHSQPSAAGMILEGGDCDGAALLLAATMRVRGHRARPVVGYVLREHRWSPHAWAEVWVDGKGWIAVDATGPVIEPLGTHLRLFVGAGSAWTMGRVLGVISIGPVDRREPRSFH